MLKKVLIISVVFLILAGVFLNGFHQNDTHYLALDEDIKGLNILGTGSYSASFPVDEYVPIKYSIQRDSYNLYIDFIKDESRGEILFQIQAKSALDEKNLVLQWVGDTLPDLEEGWVIGKKSVASRTLESYALVYSEIFPNSLIYQWGSFSKKRLDKVNYLYLEVSDHYGNTLGQEKIPFRFKVYGWSWAFDGI